MAIFLNEVKSKDIFKQYHMPTGEYVLINSPEKIKEAYDKLDKPLVMKIVSDDIIHKTEAKGITLSIDSLEAAQEAYESLIKNAKEYKANAKIDGVMLTPMAAKGIEVIIGSIRDSQFGPVVMFGLGGIFVEVFKDVVFRMCPLTKSEALDMLNSIQAVKVLEGARGKQGIDKEKLAKLLVQVGDIMIEREDISEIDLNPVVCYKDDIKILDAVIGLNEHK